VTDSKGAALDDSVRRTGEGVLILDRRVFPDRVEWVRAGTPAEVAAAIRDMVTQSSGPLYATAAGLELAALQAASLPLQEARTALTEAGRLLAGARPTNAHPREAVRTVLEAVEQAVSTAELVDAAIAAARGVEEHYREASVALGRSAVELLPDGARILTHCWMDSYLFGLLEAAEERGRRYEWIATETRPYLQGARLTAHSLRELGHPVTLITDGMGAAALAPGSSIGPVDALVTAADRVSLDGSVVNKVGTLALAVAASAFEVPFHALVHAPDPTAPTGADIVIEERDPREVLFTLGRRTASPLVTDAWYPAFDLTPARFVTSVVTTRGAFAPDRVADHFSTVDRVPGDVPALPRVEA
jgi:methylthioribose-1-phosphate isomerase